MMPSESDIVGKIPYTGSNRILIDNDTSIPISHQFYIPFSLSSRSKLFCNAVHVPLLAKQLLSIAQVSYS